MQLPTAFQNYMHLSKYARWLPEEERRESWDETTIRYMNFMSGHIHDLTGQGLGDNEFNHMLESIRGLSNMPSMRALMTAGPALARDNVCAYNCAYIQIDHPRAWPEILYILACATGVGYSVERQFINKLPEVPQQLTECDTVITVRDSKIGWAEALDQLLALLYGGHIPKWDTAKVRAAGTALKTMGGRASGPEPLIHLFKFIVSTFKQAQGRKLNSLECHDITCMVGDTIIVGGVRRAALICLSNLSDQRMRDAKSGDWFSQAPWRQLANNSVAYTERPEVGQWMAEWMSLYNSKSGERGIFNREAAYRQAMNFGRRRISMEQPIWDPKDFIGLNYEQNFDNMIPFGTNPCGEIVLRSSEFCNLTSVVARPDDDEHTLAEKVKNATAFGTMQATLTKFRYLRKRWRDNCEEERLLGVSINGIQDCPLLNVAQDPKEVADLCQFLRETYEHANREWSERLGIRPAAAGTCVKPEGNSSQLVNSASGIHCRYARHFIRRVTQDNMDPLTQFMKDQGYPHEDSVAHPGVQTMFLFPMRAPDAAVVDDEFSAIQKLEHWKVIRENWCDHNPSTTVNVRENEWPEVGGWVWNNFDEVGGLTFMPSIDMSSFTQTPYETVRESELADLEEKMPQESGVDWNGLSAYEKEDRTEGSREFACVAGQCEI